jgi:hypothetical protein
MFEAELDEVLAHSRYARRHWSPPRASVALVAGHVRESGDRSAACPVESACTRRSPPTMTT